MSGVTLDAGAMIALDRDDRRVVALLARAEELGTRVTVPATALAQAIRQACEAGTAIEVGPSAHDEGHGARRPRCHAGWGAARGEPDEGHHATSGMPALAMAA